MGERTYREVGGEEKEKRGGGEFKKKGGRGKSDWAELREKDEGAWELEAICPLRRISLTTLLFVNTRKKKKISSGIYT